MKHPYISQSGEIIIYLFPKQKLLNKNFIVFILVLCVLAMNASVAAQDLEEVLYESLHQKQTLASLTPDWLKPWAEFRVRYENYDNSFRAGEVGGDQQLALRTRLGFRILEIIDPVRFTFELADFRAPVAERGEGEAPAFVDNFDIFQLHGDLYLENVLGSGLTSNLQIGRFLMDFAKGRLIAGYRYGSFAPTFNGLQWTLEQPGTWLFRSFATEPVDRSPFNPDSPAPGSRFWGVNFISRHWEFMNTEAYYFGLDDGSRSQDRELSTMGFRLFKQPAQGSLDYEIESMYQFGLTQGFSVFANRQHGEIGFTFNHTWHPRLTYLFDFASGDINPVRNFDFLFAKRRAEYGPTGILGIIFPSNILSPAGFRLTFEPLPNVHLWILDRSFWLADSQ
ncbi:MAG: alginate export family protein, partial [Nitrospirales bacterium]|nr:alginate export family protein [Nitrospirales bacterium]